MTHYVIHTFKVIYIKKRADFVITTKVSYKLVTDLITTKVFICCAYVTTTLNIKATNEREKPEKSGLVNKKKKGYCDD